jgi:hypothetical protein
MASAAAPAGRPKRKIGERNPEHHQRALAINSEFDVYDENKKAKHRIRNIIAKAAIDVLDILDGLEERNEGRVTAALDALDSAARIAGRATKLPFGPKSATSESAHFVVELVKKN